jgi:O-antigen/teichoic acid export membrane protein
MAQAQIPSEPARQAGHGSYRAGFAFGILSFLAVLAFGLASTIATARIYGVHIIGQFALASAPVAALWVLSTAKEQAALIREVTSLPPRHPRITQLFAAVFTFSAALTATMALLAALICSALLRGPLHAPDLVAPMIAGLAGYALVTNAGWNVDSILSAFVAGRQLFWVRLHETLAFVVLAISVGAVWRSVWGLVVATIGASASALVHRVFAVRPFIDARLDGAGYRQGLRALPGLLRFGLKITPGAIAQGLSQQAGVWAIGSTAPVALVGAYSRAQTIPDRLQQVNFRIVEVLYPTLVSRHARGDGEGFDRALLDTVRYALSGMLLIAAVGGGAASSVLELFGAGFARAAPAFPLLIAYPALVTVASAQNQALWSVDRAGLTSITALGRLAVTLSLTVALTPTLGVTGPAFALVAGLLLDIFCKAVALRPFLSRPVSDSWPLLERAALLLAYGYGYAGARAAELAFGSPLRLFAALAAGTVAYLVALLALGGVNERDRERLRDVARRLPAWLRVPRRVGLALFGAAPGAGPGAGPALGRQR